MLCNFCNDPAAHDATGSRYSANMLACHRCVVSFWAWVRQHTRGRKVKDGKAWPDFYEAAGKWRSK
jgi:hydrogenase maturation factor HypF (carbamoyltransferase family)